MTFTQIIFHQPLKIKLPKDELSALKFKKQTLWDSSKYYFKRLNKKYFQQFNRQIQQMRTVCSTTENEDEKCSILFCGLPEPISGGVPHFC